MVATRKNRNYRSHNSRKRQYGGQGVGGFFNPFQQAQQQAQQQQQQQQAQQAATAAAAAAATAPPGTAPATAATASLMGSAAAKQVANAAAAAAAKQAANTAKQAAAKQVANAAAAAAAKQAANTAKQVANAAAKQAAEKQATNAAVKQATMGKFVAQPSVPPTYTCPPNTGSLITGLVGMCGKCERGFNLIGNVCVPVYVPPPPPIFPSLVKTVAANPICPPNSKFNGTLCDYPTPPESSPAPAMVPPDNQGLPIWPMKTVTIYPSWLGSSAQTTQQPDYSLTPKCANKNAQLVNGMCLVCPAGSILDGAMCFTCPSGTIYTQNKCLPKA